MTNEHKTCGKFKPYILSCVLVYILIWTPTLAGVKQDTLQAKMHYDSGRWYSARSLTSDALIHYTEAGNIYKSLEWWDKYYATQNRIAFIHYLNEDYDRGISMQTKNLEEVKERLEPGLRSRVGIYRILAQLYLNSGIYGDAVDIVEEAIKEMSTLDRPDLTLFNALYFDLALIHWTGGSYDRALRYLKRGRNFIKNKFGEDDFALISNSSLLGLVHLELKEFVKAIDYLKDSRRLLLEVYNYDVNHPAVRDINYNLALVAYRTGDFDKAKSLLANANSGSAAYLGGYYNLLGLLEYKEHSYQRAEPILKKSVTILQSMHDGHHPKLAESLLNLGSVYTDWLKYDSAKKYFTLALKALKVSNVDLAAPTGFQLAELSDRKVLVTILHELSEMYYNQDDLESASRLIQYSHSHVDTLRHEFLSSNEILVIGDLIKSTYDLGIKIAFKEGNLNKVLEYAQKAKSGLLKIHLNDLKLEQFYGVEDSNLRKDELYKTKIILFKNKLLKVGLTDSIRLSYRDSILVYQRNRESLSNLLAKESPEYFKLKHDNSTASLQEIKANIGDNGLYLNFFESDSTIYLLGITEKDQFLKKLDFPKYLKDDINRFSQLVVQNDKDSLKDLAYRIYKSILLPALKSYGSGVNRLQISTNGVLSSVPFELLLTENTKSRDYRKWPYLVTNYEISYSNDLFLNGTDNSSAPFNVLAFAPFYSDSLKYKEVSSFLRDSLNPLIWTGHEANKVVQLVGGMALTDTASTETYFKNHADDYGILHLAMHSIINNADPASSKLLFSQQEDTLNDGQLHIYELFNLRLEASMAVLSSCRTANGKFFDGEGVLSLARAFNYAGVPSIVMSHWSVDDESTSVIMEHFYSNLAKGMTKGNALRLAKLAYLKNADPSKSHPFFWGAFVVYGDDSPLTIAWKKYLTIISIVSLGLILAIVILSRLRKT